MLGGCTDCDVFLSCVQEYMSTITDHDTGNSVKDINIIFAKLIIDTCAEPIRVISELSHKDMLCLVWNISIFSIKMCKHCFYKRTRQN